MSIKIALAGNPNCGKTTLFNALTGSNQFVGNWPGVTVEKKEGKLKSFDKVKLNDEVIIMDLPGIYSLSPYTQEEVVSRNYLVSEKPNAILNIIDGTNLERNLYLTTQLAELGIPMIVAVNMMDIVKKNGDKINTANLSKELGCPVYEISALKETGIKEIALATVEIAKSKNPMKYQHRFEGCVEHALAHIEEAVLHDLSEENQRWYAVKLFERDEKVIESLQKENRLTSEKKSHIENDILLCEKEMDDDSESIITSERYKYIESIIKSCCTKAKHGKLTTSDKIDKIVTNRILALPIFAVIMFLVYYISVTTIGTIVTDFTNDVFVGEWIMAPLQGFFESHNVAPWLTGLVVDGIVGGVGAVLGFVPQMLVLFLLLAWLEACGYMARVAFIMDRIFRRFGLSGKSFIPMLIGSGCGVPGIMASRTIENDRDRKMTIITTTFIPCGAKMPIVALIAGALFGGEWWVAPSAYFIGVAAVIVSGIILKKTKLFSGDPAPFVMELPAYHLPTVTNVLRSMWERGWSFIKKAGTVILLSTIFIWFTSNFGITESGFGMVEDLSDGLLSYIGRGLSWLFAPLGWGNWKATVAAITGLVAKENVVGTFGVLYGFAEVAEDGAEIWANLQAAFTSLSAYSFLIFNLLCAPCFAAIGAIKREMNNGKWTAFAIAYQCIFAWLVSFAVFQLGSWFTNSSFTFGTIVAIVVVIAFLYLLFRPDPAKRSISRK